MTSHSFPWRQWHPTPVLLPGKSHGRRSLEGCSSWGREESDTTERLHFHFSLSWIGEGNGNPLQCSCPENPRDGGAWWAAVYGVAQSQTRLKRLTSSSSSKELQVFWPRLEIVQNQCSNSPSHSKPVWQYVHTHTSAILDTWIQISGSNGNNQGTRIKISALEKSWEDTSRWPHHIKILPTWSFLPTFIWINIFIYIKERKTQICPNKFL